MPMMQDAQKSALWLFNLGVAVSSFMAVMPMAAANDLFQFSLAALAMVASTLMHLSERKHNLPGVWPLSRYSTLFLNLDRGVAIACVVYAMAQLSMRAIPMHELAVLIWVSTVGLVFLAFSEHTEMPPPYNYLWFGILHVLWHYFAFLALTMVFAFTERFPYRQ